ncbi:Os03g0816950 [Oryza sativa Japonica Group]|uniref:Os03g0816950 protein n=2 Tax=Oryza sativa subsp. japonica TaxID=39947 RepID=C7IZK0_ORYSJ|nr:hypothetical protein EE612_021286 [Oryza sativa]BAH92415.1 Os03g0816950 [Oryza sativa Japonica Group]BAS87050.1 Os03g0816950 [Oryza sativa Japonica Group]|eukprot:NP_001173687.1 Os03g0816950 [Oryza sativa Japonica Group]
MSLHASPVFFVSICWGRLFICNTLFSNICSLDSSNAQRFSHGAFTVSNSSLQGELDCNCTSCLELSTLGLAKNSASSLYLAPSGRSS